MSPLQIRPYRDEDEGSVLDLLQTAFGGWPRGVPDQDPAELFRWKHLASPFGRSLMLVAEADGALAGFGAWLRWRVSARHQTFEVMRLVDVAVAQAHRGQGIYDALLRGATAAFPEPIALTFNAPNQLSRRGSIKVGGQAIGVFPLFVRPRAPLQAAVRLIGDKQRAYPLVQAESAAAALSDGDSVSALLSRTHTSPAHYATVKDLDYLRWRYGRLEVYRAIREHRDGQLAGLAIFRVRPRGRTWMTVICELLVPSDELRVARRLLHRVVRAAAVDYVVCHFPAGSTARRAAVRCGFVKVRSGPVVIVRRLHEHVVPDPTERDSWAICLGDLDLL